MRRSRHRDRDDLAVDRADRPALRRAARDRSARHPRRRCSSHRWLSRRAAGYLTELPRRGAGRERRPAQTGLQTHPEHRPSEGRVVSGLRQIRAGPARSSSTGDLPPAIVRAPDGGRPTVRPYAHLLEARAVQVRGRAAVAHGRARLGGARLLEPHPATAAGRRLRNSLAVLGGSRSVTAMTREPQRQCEDQASQEARRGAVRPGALEVG